ncbi:hypothetical protein [Vallitalea maricola]|uniref:hypothetical protein n=1 Tax=Vallitalea maricola TaxID=3074433 RepID=UPI0030DA72B7
MNNIKFKKTEVYDGKTYIGNPLYKESITKPWITFSAFTSEPRPHIIGPEPKDIFDIIKGDGGCAYKG